MEETKSKFALWAYPDTMKKVEKLYKEDNCKSKSEFIEKAILFYCGYLTAADYRQYFPNVIVSTMQGTLESLENRMANLLFKNTVELSMLLHAFAAQTGIDAETIEALRGFCVAEVKKIRGSFRLEDAIRFQKE